jgi:hypothetical protein
MVKGRSVARVLTITWQEKFHPYLGEEPEVAQKLRGCDG